MKAKNDATPPNDPSSPAPPQNGSNENPPRMAALGAAPLLGDLENNPTYKQALKEAMAANEAYQKAARQQSPSQSEATK